MAGSVGHRIDRMGRRDRARGLSTDIILCADIEGIFTRWVVLISCSCVFVLVILYAYCHQSDTSRRDNENVSYISYVTTLIYCPFAA